MATTRVDIKQWLDTAKNEGATHMIVMCDTFNWEDYPVFVMPYENPRDKGKAKNMQKPMECYNLSLDIEEQLNEKRANHWEM